MRYYIFAIVFAFAYMQASADVWSLDSCISYATVHNLTLQQRQVSQVQAQQAITDAKSEYLPRLSASAGQSWNLGRGLTAENTYADRNTSNFNWSASFSLPLFSGLNTERQVAYAKANLKQVTEQYEAAKEDITINVITYYLQVLYTRELYEVQLRQVDLSAYELTRQQALLEAGKIPEADMLEAQSQLASDQLAAVQAENDYVLARLDLIQLLMLDADPLTFSVAPISADDPMLMSAAETYSAAMQYSHGIKAAQEGITASERNISLARSGYLPTLSFNAGVGSSYYKISGFPNESFNDQMRHNYSTYLGFSLNVPIFDAFSSRNAVRRAKIAKVNAELELDLAQQQLEKAIQQAYYQAIASQQKMETSQVAENAAHEAFVAMQEKYNIGRATPTEFEQSKTKALRATAERIQATYEYLLRTRILAYYASPH